MVRNRKSTERKVGNTSSERMKDAVEKVISEGKSIQSVCEMYNIKFSTLRRYVQKARDAGNTGLTSYAPNYRCRQVFTDVEERLLQDYLIKASKIQFGLTRKQVRKLAFDFAVKNGKEFPESWSTSGYAGEDWFSGYMNRFPNLSLRRPEATSLSRSTSFNKKNVNEFFDNLEGLLEKHKFGPNDIYNSDETGCSTVQKVGNTKVIAVKNEKQVGKITSGERGALVTMLGTINAAGNSVQPFMVFPRVHFKDSMLHGAPPGTVGVAYETGWMTSENFKVFMQHFIQSTKCSKERPVLLLLDNHDTHLSIDTIDVAKENGVIMLTLPPHCSHRLQPLDISVYGPFKSFYNQAANDFMVTHPGKPITIHDVAQIVGTAFPLAFTPKNITAGFKHSGIYPLNRNVFSEEDFLCSYVTDRPKVTEATPRDSEESAEEPVESESVPECFQSTSGASTSHTNTVENTPTTSTKKNIVTPEEISPFPKAPARKTNGGRKKGKTMILTSTHVKEQLRVAQEKKLNKRKAETKRKHKTMPVAKGKCSKKLKFQMEDTGKLENVEDVEDSDGSHSSESEEQGETQICDDSSDYESADEEVEDIELLSPNDLKPDDYVLVSFTTKKSYVHCTNST